MLPKPHRFLDRRALLALAPPESGTRFLADGAVGGLGVLVGTTGRPRWTLAYRVEGRQFRQSLGRVWTGPEDDAPPGCLGLDGARAEAYRIKQAARRGERQAPEPVGKAATPAAPSPALYTLANAVDDYLDDPNVARLRSARERRRLLQRELASLLPRPLASVTRAEIRAALAAKGTTHIANRLHSTLGTLFRWLLDHDLAATSPVPATRPLRVEESRKRVLSDAELVKVWRVTAGRPMPLRAIVRLLVLTGQRREEVAQMQWAELDMAAGVWTVAGGRYKTKTDHVVPLVPAALALVEAQPRLVGSPWVFTNNGRVPASMSQEGGALKRLTPDLPNWRLHDLRRTFRTGLARLGVTRELADLIDHPRGGVTGTYDRHLYASEKRAALEQWAGHVAGLLGEEKQ